MSFFRKLYNFFPIQLLILQIKNHQIFVLIWAFLFLIITNNTGKSYGIPYLFLDPEYLGEVSFISFAILGAAFGGFLMTWNIAVYILDGYRFPFLATFNRPFALFSLNNSILPIAFFITYLIITIRFQLSRQFAEFENILLDISGFLSGLFIIIFIAAIYFTTTNKNIFAMFGVPLKKGRRIRKKVRLKQNMMWENIRQKDTLFPVAYYLTSRLTLRRIRSIEHYEDSMVQSVLRQNHSNALIMELVTLATLIGLGFLIDYEIFNIPAGASALLFLAILTSLSGVMSFWFKGWKNTLIILFILLADVLFRYDVFNYHNKAYGLDYDCTPAIYSHENMKRICSAENVEIDKESTIEILNNWKKKTNEKKPKMILVNVSGGGLSSAMFTTLVLQKLDSLTGGKLMNHTVFMTGSSGGMIAATYYRELYLRQQLGKISNIQEKQYAKNISKDLLNTILFTVIVNDLFFPWQKFEVGEYTYRKDRGYSFEHQLNTNTNFVLNKRLIDYAEHEKNAVIPMLVLVPTIINDQRKLFISSQPVSYLMRPYNTRYNPEYNDIDGVDFGALFNQQNAKGLQITSAIRMNSTYPYILPNVTLPSIPMIKVMDAGFRDNYGIETSTRFIHVFKDWINKNTSGVVLVQIRNSKKERDIEKYLNESIIDRAVNPISNLYSNLDNVQEYGHNYLISYAEEWLKGSFEMHTFEYIPKRKEEEASMTYHLTAKEKRDITLTLTTEPFMKKLNLLKESLNGKSK